MVMRAGKLIEQGPANEVMSTPKDPYTAALLSASPEPPPAFA
jgi:ABC-type dipeptide/oligopeptide/nickel transport system ATPase component